MSAELSHRRPPSRRLWTSRLIATLGLFVLSATFFCAIIGFVLVRQADDRQSIERRAALLGAIEDIRSSGADFTALDERHIKGIERTAGLKDLRFETEPVSGDRDVQSVLNGNGRIIGWFSWLPDRSMSNALGQLKPLMALTGLFLVGFAGIALWQVQRAVNKLSESEQIAWALAYEDMLTGLPNHRKMTAVVDEALAARGSDEVVTLGLIDIDGLKDVNDALSHRMGDDLLKAVATRIGDVLPDHASCGRFDGDEFLLLATGDDAGKTESAVAAITGALSRPFWIADQAVQVGVTAGVAHAPRDAATRDELLRCGDLALRAAKKHQRGGVLAYQSSMDVDFAERRFLEKELRRAIETEALDVHYQPIISADGNRILGAEALLRWQHPNRGAIAPMEFVPIAEQCGLMGELGSFVLHRALAEGARWPDIYVAVNLSPVQVRDPGLVGTIKDMLSRHGVPASRVVLEVTEGVLIDNPAETKARLDELKALGVRLALDDFGTGYSSLTYLQRFNFDKLKIDRGFVEPLGRDPDSHSLMQAIVSLGRALNLTLLAEGVETEEQRVLLRLAGCEEMQGFLFARPAPAEELDRLLAEHGPNESARQAAVA